MKHTHRCPLRLPHLAALLALLFSAAMPLTGCSASPLPGGMTRRRAGLAYTDEAFAATVRGQITRTETDGYEKNAGENRITGESLTGQPSVFAATVTVSAPDTNGRLVQVVYTEPASLAGLTVTAETLPPEESAEAPGRRVTVELEDLSLTASDGRFDRLLAPARALLAEGDLTATDRDEAGVRSVTVESAALHLVCVFPDDGERPTLFHLSTDTYVMQLRVSWLT